MNWVEGAVVGRYTLLSHIASGGMADVWLARQAGPQGFEKVVALKHIHDVYSAQPDFVAMFADEARLAAQLSHPNIVQLFDFGEEDGHPYIAMEYLAGESLAAVIARAREDREPLSATIVAYLGAALAGALDHAHSRTGADGRPLELVHRDIGPANLLITYDGVPKILDFGIAKARHRQSLTAYGFVKGTARYMSPEQARGGTVDGRSDLFSLGLVLFECLTARHYYEGNDRHAVGKAAASLTSSPPGPRAIRPDVPEALDAIIRRLLERRPGARYDSGLAAQRAFEDFLRQAATGSPAAEAAAWIQARFEKELAERRLVIERLLSGQLASPLPSESGSRRPAQPGTEAVPVNQATRAERPARGNRSSAIRMVAVVGAVAFVGAVVAGFLAFSRLAPGPAPITEPGTAQQPATAQPPEPAQPPSSPPQAPRAAILEIDTLPPGARITFDGEDLGAAPVSKRGVPAGSHQITASLPGRERVERTLHIDDLARDLRMLLELPAATPSRPPTSTPPAASAGRLTLQTNPWTTVSLGKRRLGDTPLLKLPLPAGRHVLRLQNPEKGIDQQVEIVIRAGETTLKKLDL